MEKSLWNSRNTGSVKKYVDSFGPRPILHFIKRQLFPSTTTTKALVSHVIIFSILIILIFDVIIAVFLMLPKLNAQKHAYKYTEKLPATSPACL